MSLFQLQNIKLHSGEWSPFKIECDVLTEADWECLGHLIASKINFSRVFGIPNGGLRLAAVLKRWETNSINGNTLIVDDVFTTGRSMEEKRFELMDAGYKDIIGAVVFARRSCPYWIKSVFQLWN